MQGLTLCCDYNEEDFLEDPADKTVPEYVLARVQKHVEEGKGDWIINSVTRERRAFADLEALTRRIASAFYKRGLRKGDTVLYMTYDMFHIHAIMLGVWRANGIMRASYPEDDATILFERIVESRVGWIVCEPEIVPICLHVATQVYWTVEVVVIGGNVEGCVAIENIFNDDGERLPESKIGGNDTALILCTSGTSGKSKGAVHSHTTLLYQIMGVQLLLPEFDLNLIASKGTHITGSVFPMGCISLGKTALVMAHITKTNLFNAISNFKPQMVFGFPTFLLSLVHDAEAVKYDFSSLEIALTGGAPVTPAIEAAILTLPNVRCLINSYGLTEGVPLTSERDIASVYAVKYPGTPEFSIGKVCVGVVLQIRDPESAEILGPYQRGEVCVKTKSLFLGYLNNLKATQETFTDDGWFKTGDIAYYDENGFVFIVDRIKEIFKYYNNHIAPTELEEVILNHPDVAEACVVGVVDPDGGDRIPRAFVSVKFIRGRRVATSQEIIQFANDKLPDYKHLRGGLYILAELPKGKTGKVSRKMLEEAVVNQLIQG